MLAARPLYRALYSNHHPYTVFRWRTRLRLGGYTVSGLDYPKGTSTSILAPEHHAHPDQSIHTQVLLHLRLRFDSAARTRVHPTGLRRSEGLRRARMAQRMRGGLASAGDSGAMGGTGAFQSLDEKGGIDSALTDASTSTRMDPVREAISSHGISRVDPCMGAQPDKYTGLSAYGSECHALRKTRSARHM